jgi:putative ABC transport system ATP-binding protein
VAIARAIAKRPAVLLCDEPTGALDSRTGIVVLEALDQVNRELGTTTLIITHNVVQARIAERVVHLRDGKITSIERNERRADPKELVW